MASEIIVNTIKAPTTGANANKVIIPSGVTLDASAGTLRPSAGAVVQTVMFEDSTMQVSTSTSFATFFSQSITPKYADSKLLCTVNIHGTAYEGSTAYQGARYRMHCNEGGSDFDFRNKEVYFFHYPTGSYYGGGLGMHLFVDARSTNAHEFRVEGAVYNSYTSRLMNRNNEYSTMIIQEIAQ